MNLIFLFFSGQILFGNDNLVLTKEKQTHVAGT